jgi:CRP-like cAMP-binding protein
LNDKGFPQDVQQSISQHLEYAWTQIQTTDDALFGDLPTEVRNDISLHQNLSLINAVPLFKANDDEFKLSLARMLKKYTIPPGQVLFKQGEEGNGEMSYKGIF